jgi:hypothetical protein
MYVIYINILLLCLKYFTFYIHTRIMMMWSLSSQANRLFLYVQFFILLYSLVTVIYFSENM